MMNPGEIKRALPHRYPMLLVDRVVELAPGERTVARKSVTVGEFCYSSIADAPHGDGDHAYPPPLVLESWCQAAAILASADREAPRDGEALVLLGGMLDVRFGEPVLPGDTLEHHVSLIHRVENTLTFEGLTTVGDRVVLTVERVVVALRAARSVFATAEESPRE